MKLIILLLFILPYPFLKAGDYKPVNSSHSHLGKDQMLTIHSDGTFHYSYDLVRMCIGKYREQRHGVWIQKVDTLALIDTLHPAFDVLPYIKGFQYKHDSTYAMVAQYVISKNGRLSFVRCRVADININEQWPDFIQR